jgi:chemotaxis family two-component system response regulator Rcp1
MKDIRTDKAKQPDVSSESIGAGRPLEILLIENIPGKAAVMSSVLKNTGLEHRVTIVSDAEAAMGYLYRESPFESAPIPDMVLLDLKLPRADGLAVLETIKRIRIGRRKPIAAVVLTNFGDQMTRRAAVAFGADAYFVEPSATPDSAALSADIGRLWGCLHLGRAYEASSTLENGPEEISTSIERQIREQQLGEAELSSEAKYAIYAI